MLNKDTSVDVVTKNFSCIHKVTPRNFVCIHLLYWLFVKYQVKTTSDFVLYKFVSWSNHSSVEKVEYHHWGTDFSGIFWNINGYVPIFHEINC